MRFRKIYVEISNLCNLSCAFCPGTKRSPGRMTPEDFAKLLPKLRPYTDFLYFHIMGEPLCHPRLAELLELARDFRVILTTNGTLLSGQQEMLLSAPALHKVNISLHAFEANDLAVPFAKYLSDCFDFGKAAAGKKLVVYRLWNQGGADTQNARSSRQWSRRSQSLGKKNPGEQELQTGCIWNTAKNSVGLTWKHRRAQKKCSATACGTSWVSFGTARWCRAA